MLEAQRNIMHMHQQSQPRQSIETGPTSTAKLGGESYDTEIISILAIRSWLVVQRTSCLDTLSGLNENIPKKC